MSVMKSCGLCKTTCYEVKLTFVWRCRTVDWPTIGLEHLVTKGGNKVVKGGCYIVITSSAIWTRRYRTCISFPSSGVSNRKSITELTTTCFSGGVGRGSSSISTSCLGVKRWRTSNCKKTQKEKMLVEVREGKVLVWSESESTHRNPAADSRLPLRSFGWACRSRAPRRSLRRTQSCLGATVSC